MPDAGRGQLQRRIEQCATIWPAASKRLRLRKQQGQLGAAEHDHSCPALREMIGRQAADRCLAFSRRKASFDAFDTVDRLHHQRLMFVIGHHQSHA
jgi:hypothetical protein